MKCVVYTQRVELIESYGERRDCADQRIADFIHACGFLPVPLPNNGALAEQLISAINPVGIILTGGNSLVQYGGNAPERDCMDRRLIELSIKKEIPLYGFCRGMQSILDYFGNELVNVTGHVAVRHEINIQGKTKMVNSYHNQACTKLKEGTELVSIAESNDGVIEAVGDVKLPIVGIMWHPEREKAYREMDIQFVKQLFTEGRNEQSWLR